MVPVVRSEWTVLAPAARDLQIHARNMPAGREKPETSTLDDGKTKVYTWSLTTSTRSAASPPCRIPRSPTPRSEVTTFKD